MKLLLALVVLVLLHQGAFSFEQQTLGRHILSKKHKAAAAAAADDAGAACCARLPAGFNSTLPLVVVDLQGAAFSSIPKPQTQAGFKSSIPAKVCTCHSPDGHDFNGSITFSERGSHSEDYNQVRSYAVKLDNSSQFLGMPKDSSWAFYGPQNDTMGLHDWFGFYLYRLTGNYAARTQYVELFVTSGQHPLQYPGDYLGLYLAMEHIGRSKHRTDIAKPTDADVTGGYILDNEHGKSKQGDIQLPPLDTSKIPYLIEYPKHPTQAMQDYILGYLRQFEAALFGPSFADPNSGWRKLANASSAIDYFLFEELIKSNNNGYRGSQRLYKDAQAPLNFGPPWDFNDGFGLCCGFPVEGYQNGGQSNGTSGGSAISPEGWSFNICEQPERCKIDNGIGGISVWYRRMWQDPAFKTAAAARFGQLRSTVWTDAALSKTIQDEAAYVHDAAMRTFFKWPVDFLNPYAPPQPDAESQLRAAVDKLITWTTTRLAWMEAQFAALQPAGSSAAALAAPSSEPAGTSAASPRAAGPVVPLVVANNGGS